MSTQPSTTTNAFTGLLSGLVPGSLQSWGLLEIVSLFLVPETSPRPQFVSALEHLKIVQVPTYGTLVLRNTSANGLLIAPMHIGFFQAGAQNHATSRVLILDAGETLKATDCFCIQQSQGGLLKEAQQRFLILPLGLRGAALSKRHTDGFSRLWGEIDTYTRGYGISRGGHLERFLRPYFHRLMPFRHAFETLPGQVGAAYFIAGKLVGVEVAPNPTCWQDLWPILNIYCYGSAALLAERQHQEAARSKLDLEGLLDLNDLARRLEETRSREKRARVDLIRELSNLSWNYAVDTDRHGLRILNIEQNTWIGQMVREGSETLYLSVFQNTIPEMKKS